MTVIKKLSAIFTFLIAKKTVETATAITALIMIVYGSYLINAIAPWFVGAIGLILVEQLVFGRPDK